MTTYSIAQFFRSQNNVQEDKEMFQLGIALALALGLFFIAPGYAAVPAEDTRVEYSGSITRTKTAQVIEAFNRAKESNQAAPLLAISSTGGEVRQALELAEWIFDNEVAVEITDVCLSSCANYVVPAAKTIYLNPQSLMAWHGGAQQAMSDDEIDKLVTQAWETLPQSERENRSKESIKERVLGSRQALIDAELAFYHEVGINSNLPIVGQTCEYYQAVRADDSTLGWYLSIEDMQRMGIRDIQLTDSQEWKPEGHEKAAHFVRVELAHCDY